MESVQNGQYLTRNLDNFHFGDQVTLQCNDGYQVKGSSSVSTVSRCKEDGKWDVLNTCEGIIDTTYRWITIIGSNGENIEKATRIPCTINII